MQTLTQAPNYRPQMQVGDLLTVPRFPYTHTGTLYGCDDLGSLVLTNTPDKGEHLCRWDDFSRGQQVTFYSANGLDRQAIWVRMNQILTQPKAYNLWNRNCEHTSNFIREGKAYSPQMDAWKGVGALGMVCIGLMLVARA